jgi:membrane-associated phospholipid phosphatase
LPDSNPLHDAGPIARKHPKLYLAAYVGGGLVLIALMVWAFAVLADEIPEQGWMERLDHAITGILQVRGTEGGESFFVAVSLFAAACGAGLNAALKPIFHRGRPEYAIEFIPHQSWSFPSGHSMNSLICYGIMLYLLLEHTRGATRRRLLIAGTAIVIILIAWARVYLGVHYLSDVIAG